MPRLIWGQRGTRTYELGVDRGVIYPSGSFGVAWPGLVSIEESYVGADTDSKYFDGRKYMTYVGKGDFRLRVRCFSAPIEFAASEGLVEHGQGLYITNQAKKLVGLSYRTLIGNDTLGEEFGYKIHIVYNAVATRSSFNFETLTDSTPSIVKEWVINTIPYRAREYVYFRSGGDQTSIEHRKKIYNPTSHLVIDTQAVGPAGLEALEGTLYGTNTTEPHLPTPAEVLDLLN